MAHLDLDTTALAAASDRVRSAGGALAAADRFAQGGSHSLADTGDAALAAALGDLVAAWESTRADLAAELDALADGLGRATEVFDGAERLTVARFAQALGATTAGGGS